MFAQLHKAYNSKNLPTISSYMGYSLFQVTAILDLS